MVPHPVCGVRVGALSHVYVLPSHVYVLRVGVLSQLCLAKLFSQFIFQNAVLDAIQILLCSLYRTAILEIIDK